MCNYGSLQRGMGAIKIIAQVRVGAGICGVAEWLPLLRSVSAVVVYLLLLADESSLLHCRR